ncbi:MAG: hypothetical protein ACP5NV_05585 [Candidatus Woesearchaeota archaeon]
MDDYIPTIIEGIPITPQEFIDGEHPWMPTDRVAGAFRLSIQYNIPVNEIMFGHQNTQTYNPRNSYR